MEGLLEELELATNRHRGHAWVEVDAATGTRLVEYEMEASVIRGFVIFTVSHSTDGDAALPERQPLQALPFEDCHHTREENVRWNRLTCLFTILKYSVNMSE